MKRIAKISQRNLMLLVLVFFSLCTFYSKRFQNLAIVFFIIPCGLGSLYQMYLNREIEYDRFTLCLIAACGFITFAALLNHDYRSIRNTVTLAYYIINMLYFGIVPKHQDEHALRRETFSIGALFTAFMFPFMLLGVISVFTGRSFLLPYASSPIGVDPVGAISSRIYVLANPNIAADYAVISILFAIYILYKRPSKWLRAALSAAIVVFVLALTHTQSRTACYALAAGIGAIAFHTVYLRLGGGKRGAVIGIAAWIAAAALVIVGILLIFSLDVRLAAQILHPADSVENTTRILTDGALSLTENGRGSIWRGAMDYLIKNPLKMLFGMGTGNIASIMMPEFNWPHLHNSFLEALSRGGIPFLICVFGMLALLVRPTVTLLVTPDVDGDRGAYLLSVLVGVLLLISITEARLFVSERIHNLLFFFAAGHIIRIDRRRKTQLRIDEDAGK